VIAGASAKIVVFRLIVILRCLPVEHFVGAARRALPLLPALCSAGSADTRDRLEHRRHHASILIALSPAVAKH
jgi:hypothetical protein